jgi:hypothetical protein
MTKSFMVVNANLRRINLQPGVRGGTRAPPAPDNDDSTAAAALNAISGHSAAPSLSPNPKNLFQLWREYQVGIGGRKGAWLFSESERGGMVKQILPTKGDLEFGFWSGAARRVSVGYGHRSNLYSVWAANKCHQYNQQHQERPEGWDTESQLASLVGDSESQNSGA